MVRRIYAGLFAIVGWFAIVGQYLAGHSYSVASTIDYFSYFTILSNILVAAILTSTAIAAQSSFWHYLRRPSVGAAAAVYITVTGLTYYFILAAQYDLHGWTKFFDHLLHYVMPPAYVLFWLVFVPKGRLTFKTALWALVPPILYAVYTFIHGPWTGLYPYPFVDVPKIGIRQTVINVAEFVIFFFIASVIFLAIDRLIGRLRGAVPA